MNTDSLQDDRLLSDPLQVRFLNYPLSVSRRRVPATTTPEDHLRDLIVQILLTNPGERVNLPEFGIGIQRFVFAASNEALRSSLQFLVSTNLERWLSDRITVERVTVESPLGDEEEVTIGVTYMVKATRQRQSVQVQV